MKESSRTCRHRGCKNRIGSESPIQFCYLHEHEQLAVTPKGQHGFRHATGPGSWQHRLQKEKTSEFPQNSANIKGYPFFTMEDLDGQVRYMNGEEKYRPTAANILDRFPIQSIITMGRNVTGNEVGIIDSSGKIHILDGKQPDVADEMRSFSVDGGKALLGIADEERYQIIVVDDAAIIESAVENGLEIKKPE